MALSGQTEVNFFSSPPYLAAVAEAFFPGKEFRIDRIKVSGRMFVVVQAAGQTVSWIPFLDMLEPIPDDGSPAREFPYLPHASHGSVSADEWLAQIAPLMERRRAGQDAPSLLDLALGKTSPPIFECSPFIDFTRFVTWDEFVAYARGRVPSGFKTNNTKMRKKLEAERQAVLNFDDPGSDVLEQVLRWKSAQYRSSGYVDGFASKKLVRSFELLHKRGLLTMSTLRFGGQLVAGHVGMVHRGRFYYWLPAYDSAFAQQSVGTVLLFYLMEESYRRGHREFDFLLGDEKYKWSYATHSRLVAPLGVPPLKERVYQPLRKRLMDEVRRNEGAYRKLQEWKRKLALWRLTSEK